MSKRKNTILILLFAMLLMTGVSNCGLKRVSTEKQKKEFLELQDEREAKLAKKREEDRKKHVERQTKEVQKRMKRQKKKMRRVKKGKHPKTFFQRLFSK